MIDIWVFVNFVIIRIGRINVSYGRENVDKYFPLVIR